MKHCSYPLPNRKLTLTFTLKVSGVDKQPLATSQTDGTEGKRLLSPVSVNKEQQ